MPGGKAEFVVDRAAAERAYTRPGRAAWTACGPTRAPTGRSWAGSCGTWRGDADRQFPDTGTGIPKEDNVHEVAQREAPESRLVYVDRDLIVLAHANQLRGAPQGTTIYIYGELSSARILPRASGSRSRPASPAGPSAVSLRRPARLPKTCATSFEAGERAVVNAQELGPGG